MEYFSVAFTSQPKINATSRVAARMITASYGSLAGLVVADQPARTKAVAGRQLANIRDGAPARLPFLCRTLLSCAGFAAAGCPGRAVAVGTAARTRAGSRSLGQEHRRRLRSNGPGQGSGPRCVLPWPGPKDGCFSCASGD